MFVGYAFYYLTRQNLSILMPAMATDLGLEKMQLGVLTSIFSLVYAFSKFGSGILSDRTNPRYFMALGLLLTGVTNIMFGFSSSLLLFMVFWGLNGWFQGFGWPPCARFLTHWYSHSERGSWWSTWNMSHNVGSFCVPYIVGFCLDMAGWRMAMYLPGILCIFGSFFLINRLRDTPESLGLPSIEKWRGDYTSTSVRPGHEGERPSTKEILFKYVLTNRSILLLAVAYFFIYIIRLGVYTWTAWYLSESRDYSGVKLAFCVSMFDVGGALGALTAGWASDFLFKAKRGPVNVIFTIGIMVAILLYWYLPQGYVSIDAAMIFFLGFTIFGPQMLIGLHAAELSHKEAAATATGFTGWFAYLGASFAGGPLGKITDVWGWQGYFWTLVVCCGIALMLLIPLWNAVEYEEDEQPIPETA